MKRKIHITAIMLLVFIQLATAQQKTFLEGFITTSDRRPAIVTVLLKGTAGGTMTNDQGYYRINGVNPGIYVLSVSAIGLASRDSVITVTAGQHLKIDIRIGTTSLQLEEVLVQANKHNRFSNKVSAYVAKMPLRNMENPQAYTVANSELLKEQDVTDFSSAVQALPGVSNASVSSYQSAGVFIRGFLTSYRLRDGLLTEGLTGGDPQNIDRLEAIKGPTSSLYGIAGSYGGLINKVTKKPFDTTYAEAGLNLGSYGFRRVFADINTPLNQTKTVLFRLNTAYRREDGWQDYGKSKSFMFAPSLTYLLNERLTLDLDGEFYSFNATPQLNLQTKGAITASGIDQLDLNYDRSYSSPNFAYPMSFENYYSAALNYRISKDWKLSTTVSGSNFEANNGVILPTFTDNAHFARGIYNYNYGINVLNIQPNLTGEFRLGNIKNKVLAGMDYRNYSDKPGGNANYALDKVDLTKAAVPQLDATPNRATYQYFNNYLETNNYAVYAADLISLTDRLNVLFSLRYDYFKFNGETDLDAGTLIAPAYTQHAWSPKFGVTYQLIKDQLSLFGNYMQGFNYVNPSFSGQTFKPEHAFQSESGVKLDLLDGKISATVSYYDIRVKDKVRGISYLESIQDGTQTSRGTDADLEMNPFPGLNIITGYTFNQSKLIKAEVQSGNRPAGVPNHTGNLWSSYTAQRGNLKGLGVGFGITYNGQSYFDDADDFSIPDYLLIKASIFYSQLNYRFSLTANNLTNQKYWNYQATPQQPRQVLATVSVRF